MQHPWHTSTIQEVQAYLHRHAAVCALLVVGSAARHAADDWSDLDLLVVVEDGQVAAFSSVTWLRLLGPIFAYEQHHGQDRSVTRVCLRDGRRVDCIVTTESAFVAATYLPLWEGVRVCFSRSEAVDRKLAQPIIAPALQPLVPDAFEELVDRFWFKAVMVVTKAVRGDLLIATHLCLGVLEELCVLAMVLRDRAAGTTIHKTGGVGNDLVQHIPVLRSSASAHDVLDCLDHAGPVFDDLAQQWSAMYEARQHIVVRQIAQARAPLT